MKRRGNNEGTIYRRSDGRWCAQVTVGWDVDEDGKVTPKRKTIYGSKRSEVQEKLTKLLRDQDQGLPVGVDERMTLASYLDTWLEHGARPHISPTTYEQYAEVVRLHLKPELGGLVLVRITPTHVQALINRKAATDLSPRRVQLIHSILRRALNQALRWELVPRNVATLVQVPKAKPYHPTVLDVDQAKALIKVAQKDRLGAVFTVAAAVGLRMGEALGLRWQDLELEAGELQVVQTVKRYGGKLHVGEPKTESSQRTVAMPRAVVTALRRHRKLQAAERLAAGPKWVDHGLVFTTRRGGPLDARNVARSLRRLCTAAKVPVVRFHDLRHTAATLLLAQGVDARTIMEVLGHSRIGTTMDIYAHVLPELKRAAADAMDELLDE